MTLDPSLILFAAVFVYIAFNNFFFIKASFSSLQFSRGGGASSGGSSMGNAGFCSSRHTNTVKPGDQPSSSQEAAAMLCDICSTKFTLFNRKKVCSECKNYFCGSCVSRETPSGQVRNSTSNSSFNNAPRTCKRCKILLSIPPVRADLMELRVKDLQRYLISKKVNTKSCVGESSLAKTCNLDYIYIGHAGNGKTFLLNVIDKFSISHYDSI